MSDDMFNSRRRLQSSSPPAALVASAEEGGRSMSSLRRVLTWLAPDVALALSFLLAWIWPAVLGAATAEDCRSIMILEGLAILAAVLVGGYRETALAFLPLVVGGCVLWLFATGMAGLSWVWLGFVWSVVQAFLDGLRAHRGEFGS